MADPEQRPLIGEIEQIEQMATGYLDIATRILEVAQTRCSNQPYAQLHPDAFKSTGISEADLRVLSDYGTKVAVQHASQPANGPFKGDPGHFPKSLEHLVGSYHGLDESELLNRGVHEKLDELVARATALPAESADIDSLVEELDAVLAAELSLFDIGAITGLSVIKFAQVFSQEWAREKIQANLRFPTFISLNTPFVQAQMMVGSYFMQGGGMGTIVNTFKETFVGDLPEGLEAEAIIESMLAELRLLKLVGNKARVRAEVISTFGSLINIAIRQAADQIELLKHVNSSAPNAAVENVDGEELRSLLEAEAQAETISKSLVRRGKDITRQAQALFSQRVDVEYIPSVDFEDLPVAQTPLQDHLRQLEAAERAGRLVATQVVQAELQRQAQAELQALRATYLMARSNVKKQPSNNNLTSQLVRGEIGDENGKAERLDKADAYEVAALIYRLNELIEEHGTINAFDGLFEAVDREAVLAAQVKEPLSTANLARPCNWLVANAQFLRASRNDRLVQIGRELQAYDAYKTMSGRVREQSPINISAETLAALHALRLTAQSLEIRAFPPGVSNLNALEEDALDLATRPGSKIVELEWERLLALDELSHHFTEAGYDARLFRLLPGSLKERFPYYAVVIDRGGQKVVVAENPKPPNATYVFEEVDPEFASWQEIVQLNKTATKELGGRAMTHSARSSLNRHYRRVQDEVVMRLSAKT